MANLLSAYLLLVQFVLPTTILIVLLVLAIRLLRTEPPPPLGTMAKRPNRRRPRR